MQPYIGTAAPVMQVAPVYPAELVIPSRGWMSPLARDGIVHLDKPEVHLGLLATNDVIVRDPHVSRLHAVIRWTPGGYEIEDLNSTWGTYVDGHRVIGRMHLPPGATIRLGTLEMRFQAAQAPAPPATANPFPAPGTFPPAGYFPLPIQPGLAHASRLRGWLRRQAPKRYWRVFLLGLLAYIAADLLINLDLNRHAIPLVILLASAVVPITFVVYCYEEGAFADMPATVVGLTFVSGAVMGLLVAGFLEDLFLVDIPVIGALVVGVIEEGAKAAAVVWFLRDQRLRSELDGLVLGAAAGMGFATLETAGYGFNGFLAGYTNSLASQANQPSIGRAVAAGIASMTVVLVLRMILAVFGHGVWTAIVCAAIWRERGPAVLRITGGVVLAFGISVTLHALWDSVGMLLPFSLLFWPLVALGGLWILRFFIHEAVDRAKLGTLAPPPAPLLDALVVYLLHPRRRPTLQPTYGTLPAGLIRSGIPVPGATPVPPGHAPPAHPGYPPNMMQQGRPFPGWQAGPPTPPIWDASGADPEYPQQMATSHQPLPQAESGHHPAIPSDSPPDPTVEHAEGHELSMPNSPQNISASREQPRQDDRQDDG